MRRRVLDVCLLAYPRATRERDRGYLRDLALELAEADGLRRQAVSLMRGGLGERLRRARWSPAWIGRVAIGCFVVAATALAASGLGVTGAAGRAEADELACVDRPGGCTEARRLVAVRQRAGWDCAIHRRTRDGQRAIAWRCKL